MTQNKLDGPQSGKLCKTFKLTKREREGKMARQTKIKRERLIRKKARWPWECTDGTHG